MENEKKIEQKESTKHNINIVSGGKTTITAVKSVPAFDNNEIDICLLEERVKITGENLEIDKLDLDAMTLIITGKVQSVVYHKGDLKKGFMKRLFK